MLQAAPRPFVVTQAGAIIMVECANAELASKLMETLKPLLERAALPAKVKGAAK